MAQINKISTKELKRQAGLCFEGKTLKGMLCSVGATGYTEESTVANWQSVEASGNGYARYSTTIGTGSYNGTSAQYELPVINAAFSASGGAISYDRVVWYINGETYPHSVTEESPNIVIADGQTQTYELTLAQND